MSALTCVTYRQRWSFFPVVCIGRQCLFPVSIPVHYISTLIQSWLGSQCSECLSSRTRQKLHCWHFLREFVTEMFQAVHSDDLLWASHTGGTGLQFESWMVENHTQNASEHYFCCFLKEIWFLKSGCSLETLNHCSIFVLCVCHTLCLCQCFCPCSIVKPWYRCVFFSARSWVVLMRRHYAESWRLSVNYMRLRPTINVS